MSNFTALIAEDEANLSLALKEALARTWPELRVVEVVSNGPAAITAVDLHAPDVLFLDIRMPGLTGLQVAQRLAGSAGPLVVFVTAYNEYAVQAFEREAVDYLVKPVNDTRLAETVQRLKKRLTAPESSADISALSRAMELIKKLAISTDGAAVTSHLKFLRAGIGDTVRIVPVDEITHLHAQDKYISIYTAHGEHLIRISLKELGDQLDPDVFVQIHRSTIVNMRVVATAERDFTGRVMLTLKGVKDKVQVSRQYAHLFARM
jgi:DNA-binding LytR/AlgR family response regulator